MQPTQYRFREHNNALAHSILEKLLATLLEALRDAAILVDDRRCPEVVERIDHVDGELGGRVRRMVNQYQELLAGLDPLVGSRSE